MNNASNPQGSFTIDFGSLARALGLGSIGPIVSFGSAGSISFGS